MLRLNHEHVENGIKESGLKLCAIARKLGMSPRNLQYRRKTGRWTVEQICKLADVLRQPIEFFFVSDCPDKIRRQGGDQ